MLSRKLNKYEYLIKYDNIEEKVLVQRWVTQLHNDKNCRMQDRLISWHMCFLRLRYHCHDSHNLTLVLLESDIYGVEKIVN